MTMSIDDVAECLVEVPIRLPLIEVQRLTRIVERSCGADMPSTETPGPAGNPSEKLGAFARFMLQARRRRDVLFADIEFGEPAWDMLLDLYVQHTEGTSVSISSLSAASAVPNTTAMRWIEAMVARGHFARQPDTADGRRVNVVLSPELIVTIERYLTEMRKRAITALG